MIRAYFNDQADIWDEKVAEKSIFKLSAMADRLEIMPGWKVLDAGTGTGVFIPYLLNKLMPGGYLAAIDIAEKMLQKSLQKEFQGNIDFIHADVVCLPFHSEFFDAVICYSAFPHFKDKRKSLFEAYRVLKNGGRLYICHTSGRNTINYIHSQFPLIKDDLIPEGPVIREMMESAGFTDIEIDDENNSYFVSSSKLIK